MFLALPSLTDMFLGVVFLIINSLSFACSYFFILYRPDEPALQRAYFTTVCYGYLQSCIGFFAGLCLSRITHGVEEMRDVKKAEEEEAMLTIEGADEL